MFLILVLVCVFVDLGFRFRARLYVHAIATRQVSPGPRATEKTCVLAHAHTHQGAAKCVHALGFAPFVSAVVLVILCALTHYRFRATVPETTCTCTECGTYTTDWETASCEGGSQRAWGGFLARAPFRAAGGEWVRIQSRGSSSHRGRGEGADRGWDVAGWGSDSRQTSPCRLFTCKLKPHTQQYHPILC
jgi:hypothetical protein